MDTQPGLGIELRRLAVFARWRSDIVLHYVQDSALLRFTAECVVLLRKDSIEQISSDDHMERVHLSSRIVKIEQAIEQAAVQEQRLTSRIEQLTALSCPKFVRNETSGTWHKTAAAGLRLRPADWCTFCGWRFIQLGQFSIGRGLPVYLLGGPAWYEVLPCGVSSCAVVRYTVCRVALKIMM